MTEPIDPLEDELSALRPRKLTPELRRRIAARLTETALDTGNGVDSAPSGPGTPGGEGWGEGGRHPSRSVVVPAGASPLTPNPSPPEHRGRGESIGRRSRGWRVAMFIGLTSACVAALVIWRRPLPINDRANVEDPKPRDIGVIPELAPTLLNYQLALARSPEDLDSLLDKQSETTLPSHVEPVHVCTFLWSEAALHDFLGDD